MLGRVLMTAALIYLALAAVFLELADRAPVMEGME